MKVEAGDLSAINLSVQQVLSLWAHGTVLRSLTGNRGQVGAVGVGAVGVSVRTGIGIGVLVGTAGARGCLERGGREGSCGSASGFIFYGWSLRESYLNEKRMPEAETLTVLLFFSPCVVMEVTG